MTTENKAAKSYFDATCTGEVQYGQTQNGTDQVGIEVELSTGDHETVILFLSEKALPYSQEKLRNIGWSGTGDIGPQIKGKPCRVAISFETFEGKERKRVEMVKASGGGGLKFQQQATASQKDQMLAKLAAASAASGEFPPPAASKPAGGFSLGTPAAKKLF